MKWIKVPIGSSYDEVKRLRGQVAECYTCGRREWWLFRLANQPRLYVQCLYCDRIESVDGQPSADLDAYALAVVAAEGVMHPLGLPGKEVTT
jgi:hypothetical protein